MSTTIPQPAERENYPNNRCGVGSWLLTTDHKRIALLYLISIAFFFIGGFFAVLIRLELLTRAVLRRNLGRNHAAQFSQEYS